MDRELDEVVDVLLPEDDTAKEATPLPDAERKERDKDEKCKESHKAKTLRDESDAEPTGAASFVRPVCTVKVLVAPVRVVDVPRIAAVRQIDP